MILGENGTSAVTVSEEHDMKDLARSAGWDYLPRLSLAGLPAGRYLLRVSIQMRGDDARAERTIPFQVAKPADR
jgi:hypothetical protein